MSQSEYDKIHDEMPETFTEAEGTAYVRALFSSLQPSEVAMKPLFNHEEVPDDVLEVFTPPAVPIPKFEFTGRYIDLDPTDTPKVREALVSTVKRIAGHKGSGHSFIWGTIYVSSNYAHILDSAKSKKTSKLDRACEIQGSRHDIHAVADLLKIAQSM